MNPKTLLGALVVLALAACGDTAVGTSPPVATSPPVTTPTFTSPAPTSTEGQTTTTVAATGPAGECSAAGLPTALQPQDLPGPVAATRQRIVDLAVACDYDGLAALAAEAPFFTFSFGGGDNPAAFWREAEAQGDPVTRRMVEVLGLPFGVHDDLEPAIYAWPELATLADPTDADYDQVRGVYDEEAIELFEEFEGYIGYRAGIQADGAWLSFVAGD